MLQSLVENHRDVFERLVAAWHDAGAQGLEMWDGETQVFGEATLARGEPMTIAPIQLRGQPVGELRVRGLRGAVHDARLLADAELASALLQAGVDTDEIVAELSETQDQLLALYDLTRTTGRQLPLDKTLSALTTESMRLTKACGAFTYFAWPGERPRFEAAPKQILDESDAASLFQCVQKRAQPILVGEGRNCEALPHCYGAKSWKVYVIPIHVGGQVHAAIGFVFDRPAAALSPELKLSQAIARQAETYLENSLLHQEAVQQAQLRAEVELAQSIQIRLLPRDLPRLPGLEIGVRMRPANQVGGDFYDFILSGRLPLLSIGDAAGKGLPAALVMSMTHTVIQSAARFGTVSGPADILAQANRDLYDDLSEVGLFVTAFVAHYDAAARALRYANAGHAPVIQCLHGEAARLLEADAPPLGVLPNCLCCEQSARLAPGDVVVLATDGLNEAHNASGELFGYDRLLRLVEQSADLAADEIAAAIFAAVDQFGMGHPQVDDQTLVVCKGVPYDEQ